MARGIGEQPNRSVADVISQLSYPAEKQDIIDTALDLSSPAEVINFFQMLPDRTYESREDVMRQFGETATRFGIWLKPDGTTREDVCGHCVP
jgi:hypothetical protein